MSARPIKLLDDNIDVSLVLLDLQLPGLDGFDFMRALARRAAKPPVLIVTSASDYGTVRQALSYGALGFISKSAGSTELALAIQSVRERRRYVPPDFDPTVADNSLSIPSIELSDRQHDVLRLMQRGCSNNEIAVLLRIAEPTVKTHISNLFRLLGAKNRTSCVREAIQRGLLNP